MDLLIDKSDAARIDMAKLGDAVFPKKSYTLYISIFFLAMIGLSFGYVMALTTSSSLTFVYQGIELLSYLLLIYSLAGLIKINKNMSYARVFGFIYLLWQFVILLRGDYSDLDYFHFKQLLFDLNYGGMVFFIPVLLFIDFNLFLIKRLFDTVVVLGIVYLLLAVLNLNVLFSSDLQDLVSLGTSELYYKYFVLGIGLLVFNFNLLSNKVKFLVLGVLVLALLVAIFRARRGMLFMTALVVFYGGFNFFLTSKRKFHIIFYVVYFLIGLSLLLFYSIDADFQNISFFRNLSERGLEDTRSYVEGCFYNDMSVNDWIFGKGYNGGYRCPGIDAAIFKDNIRRVIETDYLQLIMTGGFINLFFLFLIMVPAIVLGLFFSKNNLVKNFAVLIFLWLVFLYPANVYSVNVFHVSVWFGAGICYCRPLRMLSNKLISKYFLSEFTYHPITTTENA